jgi:hypothetical protein
LLEASRARRIKTLYTQQHESQPIKSKSSSALVVSTVRDEEKGGASTVADAGRALVRKEETETKKSQSSGGGILVVRHVQCIRLVSTTLERTPHTSLFLF